LRRRRVTLIAIFIVLIIISLARVSYARYNLPDLNKTYEYARNLIEDYNSRVDFSYKSRLDFDSIKIHFSLYHEVGNSFRVILVQSVPNDTRFVFLIFIPIGGNDPEIKPDYDNTFTTLFPNSIYVAGSNVIMENLLFEYSNTVTHVTVALEIFASDLSGDDLTIQRNAKNESDQLYQFDKNQVPPYVQSQTTASSQSTNTPTGIIGWLGSLSIRDVFYAIVALLVLYFGGIRFIVQLANPKERKKVIDEIKQLLRLFRLYRPKKADEIKNENPNVKKTDQDGKTKKMDMVEKERAKTKKSH